MNSFSEHSIIRNQCSWPLVINFLLNIWLKKLIKCFQFYRFSQLSPLRTPDAGPGNKKTKKTNQSQGLLIASSMTIVYKVHI